MHTQACVELITRSDGPLAAFWLALYFSSITAALTAAKICTTWGKPSAEEPGPQTLRVVLIIGLLAAFRQTSCIHALLASFSGLCDRTLHACHHP